MSTERMVTDEYEVSGGSVMVSMAVDTDHGAYDALPVRVEDGAPGGAVLSVFCEGGALVGFVASLACGRFGAVVAGPHGGWSLVAECATAAGAVNVVAES
jgi:hypothetical protein